VGYLPEAGSRGSPHALCGRIRADQLGILALQLHQLLVELVINRVRDGWRVKNVIPMIVLGQLDP